MTIKTRFNIGQMIKFEWWGQICQEKIRAIYIGTDLQDKVCVYYQTAKMKLVEEDKVIKGE